MVSNEQVERYFEDGYLIVEGLFEERELQPVIDEIGETVGVYAEGLYRDGQIANRHEEEGVYSRLTKIDGECPGAAARLHLQGVLRPEQRNLWSHPKLLDIVEQLLGPEIAGHPVWNLRCKTPKNPLATVPWHQDAAYLSPGADRTFQPTAWIPLLDADETNGTLQVVRGGHKIERLVRHQLERTVGHQQSWYLYIDETDLPDGEIVTCEMPLGSVLFINQLIPHRSTENFSDKIRWSMDLRWQKPGELSGLEDAESFLMRTGRNPNFAIEWPPWANVGRIEVVHSESRAEEGDSLDRVSDAPWLQRWS